MNRLRETRSESGQEDSHSSYGCRGCFNPREYECAVVSSERLKAYRPEERQVFGRGF